MAVTVNPDPTTTDGPDTTGMVQDQSPYQDIMDAPILYENAVDDDATNGLGVLYDFTSFNATWNAGQVPTAELIYPIDGQFVKELKHGRIVMGDVNRDLTHQKFRITAKSVSTDSVTVTLAHIIGEFLNTPLKIDKLQMPDASASWAIGKILDNAAAQMPEINYDSDVVTPQNVDMDLSSSNAINALLDPDQEGDSPVSSVNAVFGGDWVFDNFTIYHRQHAGGDPRIYIKYGDRIQTYQQDQSVENTYAGILATASYNPGPALATENNVDWSAWSQDWSSVGSVSYNAGQPIQIYDSPVQGHHVVGTLNIGQQIKLGTPLSSGTSIDDQQHPGQKLQVNTVWGHTWYPINAESDNGVGGWIDGTWINFDKTGDYLVNHAIGHVTVDVKGTDTKMTRYPIKGTATVNYSHGIQKIHGYEAPDPGENHFRKKGHTYKNGKKVRYTMIAIDENGDKWYQISNGDWLYGPHLSIDKNTDVAFYPSKGKGKIKKGATKYHINTKTGEVTEERHHLSATAARRKKQKPYKIVYRGKGKHKRKVKVRNPMYRQGSIIKLKHMYRNLNYGQVSVGGTLYYKLSNGSYVKASQVDFKARYSDKPKSPDDIIEAVADKYGKVVLYEKPSKAGDGKQVKDGQGNATTVTIPDGAEFSVDYTAQGADGETWYEVTYQNQTGWIPASQTSTTAVGDQEPKAPDDTEDDPDDTDSNADPMSNTSVDDQQVHVTLPDSDSDVHNGVLYAPNMYDSENTRIMKLDLSSYIKHDDQDQSGLQNNGTWAQTADDQRQLLEAAKDALIQYKIGQIPVTLTVTDADLDDVEADLTALHNYDTAHVIFTKYNDQEETAEVTATTWTMAGQDSHYISVTIGKKPESWQHLLSKRLQKNTNDIKKQVGEVTAHTGHLFSDMRDALKVEGSERRSKEVDIMKNLGLVQDDQKTLKVSLDRFDQAMQSMSTKVNDISQNILNGGTDELQFLDANGNQNFLHPTQIRAVDTSSGGALDFNSHGLGFFDPQTGQVRASIDSQGNIVAEQILGGEIEAMNFKVLNIDGGLHVTSTDGGAELDIDIGNQRDATTDSHKDRGVAKHDGYHGVQVNGSGYTTRISEGAVYVSTSDGAHQTELHPTWIKVDNVSLKGWVESWIRDSITINGKKYRIWEG